MKTLAKTMILAAACAAAACSWTSYKDPKEAETVNVDWGSTDLQNFSQQMVKSLKESPDLAYLDHAGKGDDKRVIVYMGGIENRTDEHIDTSGVSDAIRTELKQSNRFRFVADSAGQGEIGEQVRFQQESGRVNPEMAKKFGKQLGADVVVYGTLRSIRKEKGRSIESGLSKLEDTYYQFVLNCVNLESGEIVWTDKGEIRKTQRTGILGAR